MYCKMKKIDRPLTERERRYIREQLAILFIGYNLEYIAMYK